MAEATKSNDRNKIYAAGVFAFLVIVSILYLIKAPVYIYIVAYMWFGFIFGVLQQYGRFCFASAWRDLIMVKVPRMFVGIMIGLMTLSIINAFVASIYPSTYVVDMIGLHVLAGGFIFGLGMVMAGGCATGSLYKTGEGNMVSLTVLLTLSFSQAIFVATLMDPFTEHFITGHTWNNVSLTTLLFGKEGFTSGVGYSFAQHFLGDSLINAILVSFVLLIGVYIIWVRRSFLKQRTAQFAATAEATADGGSFKPGFKDELAGFWSMISASRRTTIAAVLIGVVAAAQIFTLAAIQNKYNFINFGQVLADKPAAGAKLPNGNPIDSKVPDTWPQNNSTPPSVSKNNTVFDPGYWYITTQEAMAAGWTINSVGNVVKGDSNIMGNNAYFGSNNGLPKPWQSPALLLSIGLILGASFLALINREFKWKFPTKELFTYAVIGGTLMGIGARIGLGCNIGAFYGPAAFGNPSGWVFFAGMGIGAFVSAQIVNWFANRKMAKQMGDLDFDIDL